MNECFKYKQTVSSKLNVRIQSFHSEFKFIDNPYLSSKLTKNNFCQSLKNMVKGSFTRPVLLCVFAFCHFTLNIKNVKTQLCILIKEIIVS